MIQLMNLTKKFGEFTAVDGIDLTIETGEFFGLLGPNGAGKSTTIGMMSTLMLPTGGEVRIDGQLLDRKNTALKRKLSVVTQEFSMRQDMTMEEVMEYQGRLYFMARSEIREKTRELLDFAGLDKYRKRTVRKLSGGMKRKLMVCRALLTDPEILLLDEPTAGMDALARRQMWNLLKRLNEDKFTILLTTHYMEEAEALCDRVALMDRGKIDSIDAPAAMIEDLGKYAVDLTGKETMDSRYFGTKEEAIEYISGLDRDAALRNTTLEDVFLTRMGRSLERK